MAANECLSDAAPPGSKNATHRRAGYPHPIGNIFLLQSFQVDLPYDFYLFQTQSQNPGAPLFNPLGQE